MEKKIINTTTIEWDTENGTCTFNAIPTVSMWINSTYQHIMSSVVDMVGEERFLLALQKQGRKSITDDWKIISQHPSFEEGLNELSKLSAIGGWGVKKLIALDFTNKHATFRIHNSVEGRSQKAGNVCWGSGLIAGKLAGYCEKLFDCKCWPEQIKFIAKGDPYDEFLITESNKSVEREINRILHTDQATKADMAVALKQLEKEVSYRIKAENEARKLANFDSLTGLTNRRYFNNELSSYISIASKTKENGALLFMDLDNFKDINDSLGHEQGDLCLKEVTHRLLLVVNSLFVNASLSRIGGDEFTLLLSSLSNNIELAKIEAEAIAKQIFNALDNPIKLGDHFFYQRISIGIRFFLNDKDDPNSILKQADIALYKAKQEGKSRFCFFDQQLKLAADQRLTIINELQHGLKNHHFLLYYQPIFNLNNVLIAYEALIRLRNTHNKIQKAEHFIEILEKSSLMIELGRYVFNEACQQLKKWEEQGFPKSFDHLSINISPNEFIHPDFTYFVKKTIKKHEVNPAYIMLEISENLMLNDIDLVTNKMKVLQKLGFRFSLDDFGTGYSSLSYLRNLPFSELKIDKIFIKNIINEKKDRVLLSSIINMSNSLDLTVVVEGVESIKQKEILIEMGSSFFQGDFLGKPAEPKPVIL